MKKKIAIIGSGIAGLTLANFLKFNSNFEFMLYERKESLPIEEGYGIQLAPNSIKILNQIDFNKIDNKKIFHPNKVDFYNVHNKKICNLDLSQFNQIDCKYSTLQRSTLIEFLKENIYAQHLRFGKKIDQVSELKGKIFIKFDDNTNDLVDYLIAADGIFSETKSFFEKKKNKPKFKKAIAIRSILKSKFELDIEEKNISLIMGGGFHLVLYPINKNKELNLVSIIREKKYDPDNLTQLIKKKVLNQNPNFKDIFSGDLKSWPIYSTPQVLPSTNEKVFYIGDAFHGLLPSMAQGAGQSIESAYELFNVLNKNNKNAQRVYFNQRSKRIKLIKRRSNLNFFIFHFSSSILQSLRNFIMQQFFKRSRFVKSYLKAIYKN